MSIKGSILMLTTMGMMMDASSGRTTESRRSPRYTERRKDKQLPESIGIPVEIHKGNMTEPIDFEFNWQNCILRINCTISYGTQKSRSKKIKSTEGYLKEYLKVTSLESIKKFGQFTVEELPVKEGALNKFI